MIYPVSGGFARQKTVPPFSHYPPALKETAEERRRGLIAAGFNANDLKVVDGKLFLVRKEADELIEL